ncbi:MAG: NTP transferase domain-containing protein [Acidimicrobiia bacterium]
MTTLIVPVRDFGGMTRLSDTLSEADRRQLTRDLAVRVVLSGLEADLRVVVVTANREVAAFMQEIDVGIHDDPERGLSAAAAAAAADIRNGPWVVAHADLPLVAPNALRQVAQIVATDTVLVPSLDGGTNVIGSRGAFPFSYGKGSFHRHLASFPSAVVLTDPRLAVDIDLPVHLQAVDAPTSATIER